MHVAADHRAGGGRESHDGAEVGEHARGALAIVQVADNGAPEDRAGASSDRLNEAQRDQRLDGGGEGASEAGREEQPEPAEQQRQPPVAVRERPVHELRHREAGDEDAERELDHAHVGAEDPRHVGQRGEVEVGRERSHRHHTGEKQHQRQRIGTQHSRRGAARRRVHKTLQDLANSK